MDLDLGQVRFFLQDCKLAYIFPRLPIIVFDPNSEAAILLKLTLF